MEEKQIELDDDTTFAKEALICSIGEKLKQAREDKSLTKEKVLQELKFNASFLDALEDGQWSEMPGEIYALGFLRQYADLLGLDLSADIERIKTSSYELTTPLTYPDAPISPNKTWAVIAALIFILVIIITNLFVSDDTIEQASQETENTVSSMNVADIPSPTPLSPYNSLEHTQQESMVSPTTVSPQHINTENAPQKDASTTNLSSYTFTAVSDDVWLQVYEQTDGDELKLKREALLRQGQAFSIKSKYDILITSGKPTALKVTKNQNTLYQEGSLGEEGKILKLFPL